jgi:branched-chain amino acid transport system substrate-binding protein
MTAYGKGEADYQQAALRRDGVDSLIRESYVAGDADYSRQLEEILALHPDAILLGGLAVDSGLIALQARRLGYKGQIAGGVSVGTPEFIKVAGAAADEAIFASAYIDGESAMERDFSRRYKAKWGEEPESHGVEAYDGMMMAIEAIKRSAGALTRDEIARQLHATRGYQGLQGAFTFQNNGEGISRARVGIIERGRLTAVEDSVERPRS